MSIDTDQRDILILAAEKNVSMRKHGAREEREAVVRWLRTATRELANLPLHTHTERLLEIARRIEAGEHRKRETDGSSG